MLKLNLNKKSLALGLILISVPALGSPPQERRAERVRWIMGTLCEIDAPGAPSEAVSSAFAEIERWDRILSLYKEESEASALNRSAGSGPFKASADFYQAVAAALDFARATDGAFDPTIFPVLRGGPQKLPLVGWRKVRLNPEALTVELPLAGMGLDFGGIGKGWALDKAAAVLKAAGVTRAQFNFGGQILTVGAWPVLIPGRTEPLTVADASVSASGNSEKPGHIKSPFDGLPVLRAGSTAVIMSDATAADAWSTALFVLGKNPSTFHGRSFFNPGIPAAPPKGGRS